MDARKYTDIAFGNPRGMVAREVIKKHWNEIRVPMQKKYGHQVNVHDLYITAVWEYGVVGPDNARLAQAAVAAGVREVVRNEQNTVHKAGSCYTFLDNCIEAVLHREALKVAGSSEQLNAALRNQNQMTK